MTSAIIKLGPDERMSVTRWGKRIRTSAEKGAPGTPYRRISNRINAVGKTLDWHPTKGWRGQS